MARNRGAQGKKPRCKECGHPRGPRVLEHRKQAKGKVEERKQHKNFCGCACHVIAR